MDTVFVLCLLIFLLFKWMGSKADNMVKEREWKELDEWKSMVIDNDLEYALGRKIRKFETREDVLLSAIQTIRTFDDLEYADFSSDNSAVNQLVVAIEMAKVGKLPSMRTYAMLKDRDLHNALDITPTKESYLSMYKWFEKMVGEKPGKTAKLYLDDGSLDHSVSWRICTQSSVAKYKAVDDLKTEEDINLLSGAIKKYTEEDNNEIVEFKREYKKGCFSDKGCYAVTHISYTEPRW